MKSKNKSNEILSFQDLGIEIKVSILRIVLSFVVISVGGVLAVLLGKLLLMCKVDPLLTIAIQCIIILITCYCVREIVRLIMIGFGLNKKHTTDE